MRSEFLGKPHSYWLELSTSIDLMDAEKRVLLNEVITLRGLVGHYESRIKDLYFTTKLNNRTET